MSSATGQRAAIPTARESDVPPLENGARLSSTEFMRRYEAMPELKKAELIDGIVYLMSSPVRAPQHAAPDSIVQTWLGMYAAATPGAISYTNPTVRLDRDDTFQPDAVLRLTADGSSTVDADGYVIGPPEFVAEIAASSASIDAHAKLDVYRRAGVREYLLWRTEEGEVDWYSLEDDEYHRSSADESGAIESRAFPGLRLARTELLAGDGAAVLDTLRKAMDGDAYARFRDSLAP